MCIFIYTQIYIFVHNVNRVDEGRKDPGLGKSRCDRCFQIFYFLLFLEEGEEKKRSHTQPPHRPSIRNGDRPPGINSGSRCGALSEGSAQMVWIVLKRFQFRGSGSFITLLYNKVSRQNKVAFRLPDAGVSETVKVLKDVHF